jgi:hypothetical protein
MINEQSELTSLRWPKGNENFEVKTWNSQHKMTIYKWETTTLRQHPWQPLRCLIFLSDLSEMRQDWNCEEWRTTDTKKSWISLIWKSWWYLEKWQMNTIFNIYIYLKEILLIIYQFNMPILYISTSI